MEPRGLVRAVMTGTSLLMIAAGGALFYFGEEMWGIALTAFGIVDLLTVRLVLGFVSERRQQQDAADPIDPAMDPSYNPYARED